jgi:hypothetical protein
MTLQVLQRPNCTASQSNSETCSASPRPAASESGAVHPSLGWEVRLLVGSQLESRADAGVPIPGGGVHDRGAVEGGDDGEGVELMARGCWSLIARFLRNRGSQTPGKVESWNVVSALGLSTSTADQKPARVRTMSKSQRKRLRHKRKPCTFAGCRGTMRRSDVHSPYAIKWFCNTDAKHVHVESAAVWRQNETSRPRQR